MNVTISINTVGTKLDVDPRRTLLELLRSDLNLTGTKRGCDRGQCGACTVHVNDERVLSCLTLAVFCDGASVTTVEGLAHSGALDSLQSAFVAADAFQCGFCTSGQLMSASSILQSEGYSDDDDLRDLMSGNLCRCGAYQHIVAAIKSATRS